MNVFVVMKCFYPGEELIAIEKTEKDAVRKCSTVDHFWVEIELGKSVKKQIKKLTTNENWPKRK